MEADVDKEQLDNQSATLSSRNGKIVLQCKTALVAPSPVSCSRVVGCRMPAAIQYASDSNHASHPAWASLRSRDTSPRPPAACASTRPVDTYSTLPASVSCRQYSTVVCKRHSNHLSLSHTVQCQQHVVSIGRAGVTWETVCRSGVACRISLALPLSPSPSLSHNI